MHIYKENEIIQCLDQLPVRLRIIFALSCALRLIPAYHLFHSKTGRGDPAMLSALLERLWSACISDPMEDHEARENAERCLVLIPTEDEGWDEDTQPYAEDAAAAVAYAYRARLTGSSQEAAWAARRIYESLDRYVQRVTGAAFERPEDELAILAHPAMQDELARQQEDLADLANMAQREDIDDQLSEIRKRSERKALRLS